MRVKFKGGPRHNNVQDFPDNAGYGGEHLRYAEMLPIDWRTFDVSDPYAQPERREGRYSRTETTLKNGTVVYQWMGWRE